MPAQEPVDPNGKPSIYVPYNPSGGEGGYMFTDLAHLDRVIAMWQTFKDDIEDDGTDIRDAAHLIVPPADDQPSVTQASTARESLLAGLAQNRDMWSYAKAYLDRMVATRAQYVADDHAGVDRLRNVDPG